MRPPSLRHRTVGQHLRISFPHLQFSVHFFSQFQLNSNDHTLLTSSKTVHTFVPCFLPQEAASIRNIFVYSARFRGPVYRRTLPDALHVRLSCCRRANLMSGIVLILHLSCEKSCLLAYYTLREPHVLVWVLSIQRASRSMLMESRMVSSGSLATAGIVSVNSCYAAHAVKAKLQAISSDLQFMKLHHFKLEIFQLI